VPYQQLLSEFFPNSLFHRSLGELFAKQRDVRYLARPLNPEIKGQLTRSGCWATIQQKEFNYATHHQIRPLHFVARYCRWTLAEGNCHSSS